MNRPHLSLVGLGLGRDAIPVAGLKAAQRANHVFLEGYTALAAHSLEELSAMVDSRVERVDRAVVEGQDRLLTAAQEGACLLVVGDPLSATTHTALQLAARDRGIPVEVHFAGSILTAAAGLLGLSHYKFGRTTTLVTPRGSYFPESPYEVVAGNHQRGLHTLVLLDIREDGTCMTTAEGAELLLELERRRGEGVLDGSTLACAIARAGYPDQGLYRGGLKALSRFDAGEPMHALVVPGELSPFEREALEALAETVGPS